MDPTAPSDLVEKVKALVATYGSNIPVEKSTLYDVGYLAQMVARERLGRASEQ